MIDLTFRDSPLISHDYLLGHIPLSVRILKRASDILIASLILIVSFPFWPIIALAIKLDSPGPVIFSQIRIGEILNNKTTLFKMMKFRSMRQDAELSTGPTLAKKNDVRVTRVGGFLRKFRFDEFPQLINVIMGDMSMIGPRPERPEFYPRLDMEIPFFSERTLGLKPGITGFSQAVQGYDTSLDDVRRKVGMDHAYAMRLHSVSSWIKTDLWVLWRTFLMVARRGGQ